VSGRCDRMAYPTMSDEPGPVTLTFQLTSADVFRALAVTILRRYWLLLMLPLFAGIAVVLAIVDPATRSNLPGAFVAFLMAGLIFLGLPYFQTRAVMKSPSLRGPMRLTASGAGIEYATEHSQGTYDWALVKRVVETRHAILIHLNPAGFQIAPKGQLSAGDVASFRSVLRAHVHG